MYHMVGLPAARVAIIGLSILSPYHINAMYPTGYVFTLSLVSDTSQEGYFTGRIPTRGVRSVPIELETAG